MAASIYKMSYSKLYHLKYAHRVTSDARTPRLAWVGVGIKKDPSPGLAPKCSVSVTTRFGSRRKYSCK